MPKYNYKCNGCNQVTSATLSIRNRLMPTEEPCLTCGESKVMLVIGKVGTVTGVKDHTAAPEGFKNLMKDIHKKAGPKSVIDV
ncbi:hypothetical protein HWC21_gp009 [Vibrio phage VAP7]|uniref:Uncharacterized protein n=2 Tax=Vapseptimavirus VAP7 TaxID=2841303 RepID=A0A4Y5TV19_9CAUD|nr:hypothetical protein HWC21_gp009 [Vibrio phage VAP7]AWY10187.1 regulatory hypothetical protein [Vibrio phage VP-1]QDB73191.1 hypothetical protein [Vibrio phage VAP7]UFD98124.1 hypothetical protein [Vibrio phage BX-1]